MPRFRYHEHIGSRCHLHSGDRKMKEVVVAVVVAVAALLLVESGDSKTISKDANKFVYLEDVTSEPKR